MPVDLTTAIPLIVSVLGALGIGSVIGQWAAGAKDRRAARAAALKELAAVETARWNLETPETDGHKLHEAIRQLEIAALIARIPRSAVMPYAQLATASHWYLQDELEIRGDPESVGLTMELSDPLINAAEIVSRAAWATPATRWLWLPRRIRQLDHEVSSVDNQRFQSKIKSARRSVR